MAGKHVKPRYVPKAERIAQQKRDAKKARPPITEKKKLALIIGGGVLAVALLLLIIFYHGPNLRVTNGEVQVGGDNWIVSNLSSSNAKRYFKLGEANPAPGYVWKPESSIKYDTNEKDYWFEPEEEGAEPYFYYISGVNAKAPEYAAEARANFAGMYGEEVVSEVQTATIGGHEAYYFTSQTTNTEVTPPTTMQMLTCYLPATRNASILVTISYHITEETPAPTSDAMLAMLETIVSTITFEKAK